MASKPGILLGQITKTIGFDGTVNIRLEKKFINNIPELESVFLEIDGKPVPFFIEQLVESGPDLRVIFEDYGSVEKIGEFRGSKVFLVTGEDTHKDEPDLSSLQGFTVFNQKGKKLGLIMEVIPGPQLLLSIKSKNQDEILIPLHEDLIISVDDVKKTISMEIPEGLTDINT